MLACILICFLCALFQPICETLLKIPTENLEVSGNALFVEKRYSTILTANFIHDGWSHSLYNILITLPIVYNLEYCFKLSFLFIIFVILLCGIIGFLCSVFYNKYKHGDVGYFIPHCGFSHSMYGVSLFMCYLYPTNVCNGYPLISILASYVLPDFFGKSSKHNKKFWILVTYLTLINSWIYYKINKYNDNNLLFGLNINSSLYLFLFDISFIKSKIYYRWYLDLPAMCDHCGHLFGIIAGLIIGFIYNFMFINQLDIILTLKHASFVFSQWPLCFTILFAVYRVKVNW